MSLVALSYTAAGRFTTGTICPLDSGVTVIGNSPLAPPTKLP
eukprot:CAMPEP_0119482174 /NCGR_PEP_ID=MMETSP1344-20130328/10152_1 /TAXON_ID=236787 /ORGANISM="Florenciella parvula, Strain CCMP2471" /LENGTH=41 /DNA_ID= /DNA_START= /DNA_END= /DNA_ORIENTATION=